MVARAVLLVATIGAAVLGFEVARDHFDARDRDRALLTMQTARFGPGTRGRIEAWLAAEHPGHETRWSATGPGLFGSAIGVRLEIAAAAPTPAGPVVGDYRFTVGLTDKQITAEGPPAQQLVDWVATWAGSESSHR